MKPTRVTIFPHGPHNYMVKGSPMNGWEKIIGYIRMNMWKYINILQNGDGWHWERTMQVQGHTISQHTTVAACSLLLFNADFRILWHCASTGNWQGLRRPIKTLLGRSLMIGWRKTSRNPEKVPSVSSHSVCVSVCLCVRALATGHTFFSKF